MRRHFLAVVVLALAAAGVGSPYRVGSVLPAFAEKGKPVEEIIDSLWTAYEEAEGDAAKLAVCMEILEEYPESHYSADLLDTGWWHAGKLGREDEFVSFAEKIEGMVRDPSVKVDVRLFLADLYGQRKDTAKLDRVASRLEKAEKKNFNFYYKLMGAYENVGGWKRVLRYSERAEPFASAEAYRKDFPNTRLTAEDIKIRGRTRRGIVLSYAGWAKANLGKVDDALADFRKADEVMPDAYMGYNIRELDYFWGKTLAMAGRYKEAIDRLAGKAVFEGDDDASRLLRETYVKLHGSDQGYDIYLKQLRMKLSRPIDDFLLSGYDGSKLKLSSFKAKVLLVAFWFPT